MKTGISMDPEDELLKRIEEVPEEFDFVEIGIGEMEKNPEEIEAGRLKEALDENNLELVVHLPFRQPLATTVKTYNQAKIDYIEELLKLTSELGAEKAVLHASLRFGEEKEELREKVVNQIERIDSIAESKGMELCVENVPFDESKAADLLEFGEFVEEASASICLDTGHAFAEAGQEELEEFAERFAGSISHLHVQDSHGEDDHLAVGHGDIDFGAFADSLGDFTGTVTFEIFSPDYDYHELSRQKFLQHF